MQLHRDREQFDASGARLVVIGQGTPEQGAAFLASQKAELPLYVDKGRGESYNVAGTKTGTFGELLGAADGGQGRGGDGGKSASTRRFERLAIRPSLAARSVTVPGDGVAGSPTSLGGR